MFFVAGSPGHFGNAVSGVRKLTYIMMVELHNLPVEYGYCT